MTDQSLQQLPGGKYSIRPWTGLTVPAQIKITAQPSGAVLFEGMSQPAPFPLDVPAGQTASLEFV